MKFKETVIGVISLGAIGSLVGNIIQEFAKKEQNYSGIKSFFNSEITIPSWSLLSVVMVALLLVYIMILKNRDTKRTLKEKELEVETKINEIQQKFKSPEIVKEELEETKKIKEEKAKKYKLAKLLTNFLHEGYPKTSKQLCELVQESATYPKPLIMETISELVHHKVFESYSLGDGFKLAYNHTRSLEHAFKP